MAMSVRVSVIIALVRDLHVRTYAGPREVRWTARCLQEHTLHVGPQDVYVRHLAAKY